MSKEKQIIDSIETLTVGLENIRKAQKEFATFDQEKVDKIFFAAAKAANKMRISLAKMQ